MGRNFWVLCGIGAFRVCFYALAGWIAGVMMLRVLGKYGDKLQYLHVSFYCCCMLELCWGLLMSVPGCDFAADEMQAMPGLERSGEEISMEHGLVEGRQGAVGRCAFFCSFQAEVSKKNLRYRRHGVQAQASD